jgi:hypothetical protein
MTKQGSSRSELNKVLLPNTGGQGSACTIFRQTVLLYRTTQLREKTAVTQSIETYYERYSTIA